MKILYAKALLKDLEAVSRNPGVKKRLLKIIETFKIYPVKFGNHFTEASIDIRPPALERALCSVRALRGSGKSISA